MKRRIIEVLASAAVLAGLLSCGSAAAQMVGGNKAITNEGVVQMVRYGIPDGAIIAAINVGPDRFDTSRGALLRLRGQGVSGSVIEAMLKKQPSAAGSPGGGQPGLTGNGNPPGGNTGASTPRGKLTPQQVQALLAKVHRAPGKPGSVVTNPGAGQANLATLNLLQQQKQIAMTERNQGSSPTGAAPTTTSPTGALTRVPVRGSIATAAAPPRPATNRGAVMLAPRNAALACGAFGKAGITAVSGQQGSSAVFTQNPKYNPFTIRGCNFGNARGQAQLNFSNGRKLTDLTVDTWTDTLITVEVPPSLVDVLDQNNVSLILFPTNGPQAQRPGFKFSAQRVEMYLASIPASTVTLASITDDAHAPVTPKFFSPYVFNGTGRASGGVDRVDSIRFVGGTDTFDFSRLKPGFSVEKYRVYELSAAATDGTCGLLIYNDEIYTDGAWSWNMTGPTIRVTWKEIHAHIPCEDVSDASYGLGVWLIGPPLRPGESPWQDGVK